MWSGEGGLTHIDNSPLLPYILCSSSKRQGESSIFLNNKLKVLATIEILTQYFSHGRHLRLQLQFSDISQALSDDEF